MVEQAIRLLAAVPETVPRAVLISTQPWTTPFRALETGTRRWRLPLRQAAVCSSTTRGCCVWRWVRQPAPSPVSPRAPALHRAVALPQSGRAALLGEASVLSSGLAFARNRYRRSPNLRQRYGPTLPHGPHQFRGPDSSVHQHGNLTARPLHNLGKRFDGGAQISSVARRSRAMRILVGFDALIITFMLVIFFEPADQIPSGSERIPLKPANITRPSFTAGYCASEGVILSKAWHTASTCSGRNSG